MDSVNGNTEIKYVFPEKWTCMLSMTLLFLFYYYYTFTFEHFRKKGIKYMNPTIVIGNMWPIITAQMPFSDFQLQIYKHFKGSPCGGIFEGRKPLLYITDPEIIKTITMRDFDYFEDRLVATTNEPRYLQRLLFNLKGSTWRAVRKVITPTFSSLRLKNMFPIMQQSTQKLMAYLENNDLSDVDFKAVSIYYALDSISACAFGINFPSLSDGRHHFVKAAHKIYHASFMKTIILLLLQLLIPELMPYVNISLLDQDALAKLTNVLREARLKRMSSNFRGNDLLQLLIDASMDKDSNKELDEETVDAQLLVALLGGYEAVGTSLSFAIYNLVLYPDMQEKIRSEIEDVTKGEKLTYDNLVELDYLEGFIMETLRVHPFFTRVDRICMKPYVLPGTSIRIEPNEMITIPIYGIHMDPDIYPEPEKFMPERFTREGKKDRAAHLFLTFGSGPRNCIGNRFALIAIKLAIVNLLKNYKLSVSPKTEIPIKIDKYTRIIKAENEIWVNMKKI